MFERSVEFRTTDFSNIEQTNNLLKPFYKNINYDVDDNYPATTKMVLKSSSSLDFQINCHSKNVEQFHLEDNSIQLVDMIKISDSIKGGTIKNDEGTVIANWAELPSKYVNVIFDLK